MAYKVQKLVWALEGLAWDEDYLEKRDSNQVETMDATRDSIMSDGNTAAALGSV